MASATQSFVNERVYPIEQALTALTRSVDEMKENLEAMKIQLTTRDADLQSAEKRFEEIARQVGLLEKDRLSDASDEGGEKDTMKTNSLLRNPALRNVKCYTGDHKEYSRWRSKIKGILVGENEAFRMALKQMESADQNEIPPRSDGSAA